MTLDEYTMLVKEALTNAGFLDAHGIVEDNHGLVAECWEWGEPVENTATMLRMRAAGRN